MQGEIPVLEPHGVKAPGARVAYDRHGEALCPRGGVVGVQALVVVLEHTALAVRHTNVKVVAAPVVTVGGGF